MRGEQEPSEINSVRWIPVQDFVLNLYKLLLILQAESSNCKHPKNTSEFQTALWSIRNLSGLEDIPEASRCLEEVEALHSSLLQRRQLELRAAEDEREEVVARQAEAALFAAERTPRAGTNESGAISRTGTVADSRALNVDIGWLKRSLEGSIQRGQILLSELESISTASEEAVNYSRTRWRLNDLSTRGSEARDKVSLTKYLKETLDLRDSLLQSITKIYEDAGETVPQHIREAARFTVPSQNTQLKPTIRFQPSGLDVGDVKIVAPPAVSRRISSPSRQTFTQPAVDREHTSDPRPTQRQARLDVPSANQMMTPHNAAFVARSSRNMRNTSDIGQLQAILKALVTDCQVLIQEVDVDSLPANERADYSRRIWTASQAELPGSEIEVKRTLLAQIEDMTDLKGVLLEHTGVPVTDSGTGQSGYSPLKISTTYTMSGPGLAPRPSPARKPSPERADARREQSPQRRPPAKLTTPVTSGDAPKQSPSRFTSGSTMAASTAAATTPPPPPLPSSSTSAPPPPPPPPPPPAKATAAGEANGRGAQVEAKPDKLQPLTVQIATYDQSLTGRNPLADPQKASALTVGPTASATTPSSRSWQKKVEQPLPETLRPVVGSTVEENQQVVDEYMQLLQSKHGWLAVIPPPMESVAEAESDSDDSEMSLPPPPSPVANLPSTSKIPMSERDDVLRELRSHSPVRTRIDQFEFTTQATQQPKSSKSLEDSVDSNYGGRYDVLPPLASKQFEIRREGRANGNQSSTSSSFQTSSPREPQKFEPYREVSRHHNADTKPRRSESVRSDKNKSKTTKTSKHYVMVCPCRSVRPALSVVVGCSGPPSPSLKMKANFTSACPPKVNMRFVCEHIYQKEHASERT
ncbi:hypothetical protein SprV_0200619100 [Sparganum proliferum]